jgi:Ran GTPase-activating protein (RanGAP) involved in mRNA processing and transport
MGCIEALVELIEKSTTLEELYLGGNYLCGRNVEKVFHNLAKNKFLRVFDYGFNQLGDLGGLAVAQAIANCLQANRTLEHFDLSFNNFSKEASQIIANGL